MDYKPTNQMKEEERKMTNTEIINNIATLTQDFYEDGYDEYVCPDFGKILAHTAFNKKEWLKEAFSQIFGNDDRFTFDEVNQRWFIDLEAEKERNLADIRCNVRMIFKDHNRNVNNEYTEKRLTLASIIEYSAQLFINNLVDETNIHILRLLGFDKAREGQKLTRLLNKYETVDKLYLQAYADVVAVQKLKKRVYVSLSAYDFARMSSGNSWNSCHDIGGCNDSGPTSYINDSVTFLCYTEASDKSLLESRICGIISTERFNLTRLYPNDNNSKLYDELGDIIADGLKRVTATDYRKDTVSFSSMREGDYNTAYDDFVDYCFSGYKFDHDISPYKYIGGSSFCVECGEEQENDHTKLKGECCMRTCAHCGDVIYSDYEESQDGDICSHCLSRSYEYSSYHETYIRDTRAVFSRYINSWICQDEAYYCSDCEEYFLIDDFNEDEDMCYGCVAGTMTQCDECGQLVKNGDILNDEHGNDLCPECWSKTSDTEEREREFNATRL